MPYKLHTLIFFSIALASCGGADTPSEAEARSLYASTFNVVASLRYQPAPKSNVTTPDGAVFEYSLSCFFAGKNGQVLFSVTNGPVEITTRFSGCGGDGVSIDGDLSLGISAGGSGSSIVDVAGGDDLVLEPTTGAKKGNRYACPGSDVRLTVLEYAPISATGTWCGYAVDDSWGSGVDASEL